jgi:hypothetical protein
MGGIGGSRAAGSWRQRNATNAALRALLPFASTATAPASLRDASSTQLDRFLRVSGWDNPEPQFLRSARCAICTTLASVAPGASRATVVTS